MQWSFLRRARNWDINDFVLGLHKVEKCFEAAFHLRKIGLRTYQCYRCQRFQYEGRDTTSLCHCTIKKLRVCYFSKLCRWFSFTNSWQFRNEYVSILLAFYLLPCLLLFKQLTVRIWRRLSLHWSPATAAGYPPLIMNTKLVRSLLLTLPLLLLFLLLSPRQPTRLVTISTCNQRWIALKWTSK